MVRSDFLPWERFNSLRNRVQKAGGSERVHLPIHKKGATIAYERLQRFAPEIVDFYQSPELGSVISGFAGEPV